MITVGKILENSKETEKIVNEQNEEVLKTGEIKAKKESYMTYFVIGALAIGFGLWLWKKGKEQNGTISD